jgi:5'-nucleotidase
VTGPTLPVDAWRRQTSQVSMRREPQPPVLVTNDDGVESAGLHALVRALVDAGHDVLVVAPATDMSGSGAAIGRIHLDQHIDAEKVELPGLAGVPAYAVDGPPGLCVLAARLGGFGVRPDLVVSGINPGCNTGRAVLHSGTVGAALTAANFGGRGLAVSIDVVAQLVHEQGGGAVPVADGDHAVVEMVETDHEVGAGRPAQPRRSAERPDGAAPAGTGATATNGGAPAESVRVPAHWETAAQAATAALGWLAVAPRATVLNVNVPDLPVAGLAGARVATLAPFGTVRSTVVESAEDGGRLQMALRPTTVDLPPECDTALVAAGFVAVTALTGIRDDPEVDLRDVLDAVADRVPRTA